jgi:hypothetical protein
MPGWNGDMILLHQNLQIRMTGDFTPCEIDPVELVRSPTTPLSLKLSYVPQWHVSAPWQFVLCLAIKARKQPRA